MSEFAAVDLNGDKILTAQEVCLKHYDNSKVYCSDSVSQIIYLLDQNDDEILDIDEYEIMLPYLPSGFLVGIFSDIFFDLFDSDNDNQISVEQLRMGMNSLSHMYLIGIAEDLFSHADSDSNRSLDFIEAEQVFASLLWLTHGTKVDESSMLQVYDDIKGDNTQGIGHKEAILAVKDILGEGLEAYITKTSTY